LRNSITRSWKTQEKLPFNPKGKNEKSNRNFHEVVPMSTPIPEDKLSAIEEMLFQDRKIEAIKILRKCSGAALAEAKDAVEQLEKQLRETEPAKFTASVGRSGCLGVVALFFFGELCSP